MKIQKIIFLSGNPISNQVGDKINPYWYEANGFDVEYWNLNRLYFSKDALSSYFGGHKKYRFQFPTEREFSTKSEVSKALEKVTSNAIFCHIDYDNLDDYWLRRLFKNYDIQYYVGPRRTVGRSSSQINFLLKSGFLLKKILLAMRKRFSYKYIKRNLNKFIYNHTNVYQKPIFVVGSGSFGRNVLMNITRAKSFISVPSNDLTWTRLPNLVSQPYCVFVDDGVLYSPDQKMNSGIQMTTNNIDNYTKAMKRVFKLIESELNLKVVIAASFKYDYRDDNFLGDREIFYGNTNQLIQHAVLVVGHGSSAVWQVLVDLKPIILLLDDSFINEKNIAIARSASFLGGEALNTKKIMDLDLRDMVVNIDYYAELLEEYFREKNIKSTANESIAAALKTHLHNYNNL